MTARALSGGYTLLEMLMVLFIVGLTLGTLLSLGLGSAGQTQQQRIGELEQELRMNTQTSVLTGRSYGLDFYRQEAGHLCWRWLQMEGGKWQLLQDSPGSKEPEQDNKCFLDSDWSLRIEGLPSNPEQDGEPVVPAGLRVEVLLYPSRETTAFELVLTDRAGNAERLQLDLMGRTGLNEADKAPL